MAEDSSQVPAVIASGIICLIAGAGAGVLTMVLLGFHMDKEASVEDIMREAKANYGKEGAEAAQPGQDMKQAMYGDGKGNGPGGGKGPGGAKGPGGGKGPGGAGKGKGGFGPSPKTQLAQLVTKLDVLTAKPLTLELTDSQRNKVRTQLKGLTEEENLSEEEAKKRLDALLEVLKDQRATLEEAGYFWPGSFQMPPSPPSNPFKEGKAADHLKALDERLGRDK